MAASREDPGGRLSTHCEAETGSRSIHMEGTPATAGARLPSETTEEAHAAAADLRTRAAWAPGIAQKLGIYAQNLPPSARCWNDKL